MNEVNSYAPPNAAVSDIQLNEDIPRPHLLDVAAMMSLAVFGILLTPTAARWFKRRQ